MVLAPGTCFRPTQPCKTIVKDGIALLQGMAEAMFLTTTTGDPTIMIMRGKRVAARGHCCVIGVVMHDWTNLRSHGCVAFPVNCVRFDNLNAMRRAV